jgi:hypothetical protein
MILLIIEALSPARFETYLTAAGRDHDRAQKLYMWNAHIGRAFHTPIQAVEVALRNAINQALMARYGQDWWKNEAFLNIVDRERGSNLDTVQNRIRNRRQSLITGQIVAGLSFGFWVGMLQRRYNPNVWSAQLRLAFPNLPQTEDRNSLFRAAGAVSHLRNRISHHEPIFKRDISADYAAMMTLLNWICPATHDWVRPHCHVQEILRRKP